MSKPREDQFVGSLVGCAVGDALGAPIENKSREFIAELEGLTDDYRIHRDRRGRTYSVGHITDDTQLTLAVANSLIKEGGVDGSAMAQEIAQLWREETIVGAGPVAHRAMLRLMEGVAWDEAALHDDVALNGVAMRIAPIGLWYWDDERDLKTSVKVCGIITHRHPQSIAAAVVVAHATRLVMNDQSAIETLPEQLARQIEVHELSFAEKLRRLPQWLDLEEQAALDSMFGTRPVKHFGGFGVTAYAEPTVIASLYAFLKHPLDFVAAIDVGLRLGGDADTIAAIVGAISGACNGLEAIPLNLREGVQDSAAIHAVGRQLFKAKCA